MKKTFKFSSNFLVQLKNFWFGLQLLIIAVSLPVMCYIQVSHSNYMNNKHLGTVTSKSEKQNQMVDQQQKNNIVKFS